MHRLCHNACGSDESQKLTRLQQKSLNAKSAAVRLCQTSELIRVQAKKVRGKQKALGRELLSSPFIRTGWDGLRNTTAHRYQL